MAATGTVTEEKPKLPKTAIVVAATAAMLGIIYGYDNRGHRWCADLLLEGSRTVHPADRTCRHCHRLWRG